MRLPSSRWLQLAAAAAVLTTFSCATVAQDYPTRPITMVVPQAAGGPLDTIARILSERMRVSLGQPVIVENVAGAAGSIGVGRVARAAPDGYTIVIGIWTTHVANAAIHSLKYDVLNDFEPIALHGSSPQVIVARKSLPASDLKGLIAWLKANPDKATAGSAGVGSPPHVFGTFFQSATGTRFRFAGYRGGAQAMQDLAAGHIDFMIDAQANALPLVRDGKIIAFAVTGKVRSAVAPEIPTVDEAGLAGFHFSVWNATWAPKGTPKNIVGQLNAAVVEALADTKVRALLMNLGQEIFPRELQTPEALHAFQKAEIEKWWPIIKAAGIKAE
jgi:tripartite-type tricarboxylate transporter receptor subunit TctC